MDSKLEKKKGLVAKQEAIIHYYSPFLTSLSGSRLMPRLMPCHPSYDRIWPTIESKSELYQLSRLFYHELEFGVIGRGY